MAEGTRLRHLDESVKALQDRATAHDDALQELRTSMIGHQTSIADISTQLIVLTGQLEQVFRLAPASPDLRPGILPIPGAPIHTDPAPAPPIQGRTVHLEFPRFVGTDPTGWIFKAERFFDYHRTPDDQRLLISSFHMDDEALQWFQWMYRSAQFTTWAQFTRALEVRFGPTEFDDPQASLAKLSQITTVSEYQSRFETLANRTTAIPPSFLVSCFISGLRPDIRNEVMAFRPATMSHTVSLARLQEAKLLELRRPLFRSSTARGSSSLPVPAIPLSTAPAPPMALPPAPSRFPIKRLSSAEMQQRRDKGLCYNCDERFTIGHRCKNRMLFLLEPDDGPPSVVPTEDFVSIEIHDTASPDVEPSPELSYHSLIGSNNPSTLRFTGYLAGSPIQILVDGGSTHNFIQSRVARHLNLPIEAAPRINVMVGSGNRLQCEGMIKHLQVSVPPRSFVIDTYVLPLFGADLVLGVQWLATLGPVVFDYSVPALEFHVGSERIRLTGDSTLVPPPLQYHSMRRLLDTDSLAEIFCLESQPLSLPQPFVIMSHSILYCNTMPLSSPFPTLCPLHVHKTMPSTFYLTSNQ
ncbi:uncharacterized protein LOC122651046 [Telopea speciosissima]|uniref:uncharacterized protein LOC122651046 n=1 Tax=Telopea speciosissima TaxID=54955 RepID=UPI001CC34410|nr:uncharacterized protein LOC122651046 [Telopea speciosissima]